MLLRRTPCWKSTARHTRHARHVRLDKVERVESSGIWAYGSTPSHFRTWRDCSSTMLRAIPLINTGKLWNWNCTLPRKNKLHKPQQPHTINRIWQQCTHYSV